MSLYEALLTLHIVSAITWLGAALVLTLLFLRAELASDAASKVELNVQSEWLAPRVFIPSSLATFVFGLLLVIEGSWDMGTLWVTLGLAGWLASFAVGIGFFKPEIERLNALIAERGADHPDVESRLDRMEAIARVELAVLFLVVADMAIKPTGDDAGVLIAGAAILAVAAFLALRPAAGAGRPA